MLKGKSIASWALVLSVVGLAMPVQAQTSRCVTGFEEVENFDCGDRDAALCDPFTGVGAEVVWQAAEASGSSDGLITGDTNTLPSIPINFAQRVPNTGDFFGLASPSYELTIAWDDPTDATTTGARLITSGVDNLSNPSVHLGGTISFKMAVTAFKFDPVSNYFGLQVPVQTGTDAAILMCLTIKETGNDVPLGDSDSGTGDLEFVYLPGSEVIPAATNGFFGTFPPGGKRFTASNEFWPPDASEFVQVDFDLGALDSSRIRGFALDGDDVDTAGDGVLDATSNGQGVNRGVLESIVFTADPANADGEYFFIYIDDLEFTAPENDTSIPAPTVQGPIFSTDTTIDVASRFNLCDSSDVDEVELFINGVSAVGGVDVTANPVTPVSGVASFSGLSLTAGDVITATQTDTQGGGQDVTSDLSQPVVVFGPGVILADNFDNYLDQDDLDEFWNNSINSPSPADAKLLLTAGGAASCPNFLKEANPAGANAARLYRSIGSANGSDDDPLFVTWNFKFTEDADLNGRTRFELARFSGGSFTTGARGTGSAGITMFNQIGGDLLVNYNLTLRASDNATVSSDLTSNGWTYQGGTAFHRVSSGVPRVIDQWHKMQIEIRSEVLNYFIDDVNVNPPGFEDGVPRPDLNPYTHVIIGEGFSNNGPVMFFDNVSVTIGSNGVTHPFGDPEPAPPTIEGPLFPGVTTVSLTDVNTNATEVRVIANGSTTLATVSTTGFASETLDVTVPGLTFEDIITVEQTVGGSASCESEGIQVLIPSVRILDDVLKPDATIVNVTDLEENIASEIRIYANESTLIGTLVGPTTDPVAVPVTALVEDDVITATQIIGGLESEESNGVIVRFRPPLSLTATVSIDEDGAGGPADFEFVGAAETISGAPVGKPLEPQTGVWQRFEYSLTGGDPVTVFVDSVGTPGQLDAGGGDYRIDSIFFSINSNGPVSAGPYTVYVDHLFYIDSGGQEVLISDAETVNPLGSFRGQSTSCPPDSLDCANDPAGGLSNLNAETSIDGSSAVKIEWKWPSENPGQTMAVFRPSGNFPDDALAVGFHVLFNDFSTNGVAEPTLLEPNVGNIPFVRVNDVDSNATLVELFRNGEFLDSAVPSGSFVDINVNTNSVLLDQYTARQTTPDGTSELGFPRGITAPPSPNVVTPVVEGETSVTVNNLFLLANASTTQVQLSDESLGVLDTVNSTGFQSSSVTLDSVPSLNIGQLLSATQTVNGLTSPASSITIVEGSQTACGVAFSDDFNVDSSASWNVNTTSADTAIDFAFDYSTLQIPPSPNGGGSTLGLKMEVNFDGSGSVEAITASPIGLSLGGDYVMRFDMWMNAPGPFPAGGGGSTEFLTAGVGYDNATVNLNGVSGAGGWFACTGEGGSGSDYRLYKNDVLQDVASGQYLAGSRNAPAALYANNFGSIDVAVAVPGQGASQTGTTQPGTMGFAWHEVVISRQGNTVTFVFDDIPLFVLDAANGDSFPLAGSVSLGYFDIFTSIASPAGFAFGLFDNLVVEGAPGGDCNVNYVGDACETIAGFDWNVDGNVDGDDTEGFVDCYAGPGFAPAPTDAACASVCLDAFDDDADNDIDLSDYGAFQEATTP